MTKVCQPGDPRDFGEAMVYAQKLEMQRDRLREALDGLHHACVMKSCRSADNVPAKRALQEAMNKARTALKDTDNG